MSNQPIVVILSCCADAWIRYRTGTNAFSRGSKHLVRMSSEAEAHRLVRSLHMTYFEPEVHKQKYLIRASVIY